jgi:hypothetical protein
LVRPPVLLSSSADAKVMFWPLVSMLMGDALLAMSEE